MKNPLLNLSICALLLLLGSIFLYKGLVNNGFGFFNLQVFGKNSELETYGVSEIIKGDIITGKFYSRFGNLGIISVRFTNHNRDSKDTLLFRIKEQNTDKWEYTAKYNTDQFLPEELFPFGFPVISDSVGKNYTFEIESLSGATGSGIFLGSTRPVFTTSYFYDKYDLLKDKNSLIKFLFKKTINTFENRQTQLLAIVVFLPFAFYLLYLKIGKDRQIMLFPLIIIGIFFDIFCLPNNSNYHTGSLIFLWLLATSKRKIKIESLGSISLLLLFVTLTSLLLQQNMHAEKSMVWFLIILTMATLQMLFAPDKSHNRDIGLFELLNEPGFLTKSDKTQSTKIPKAFFVTLVSATGYSLYLLINILYSSFALYFEYYLGQPPYVPMILLALSIFVTSILISYAFYHLKKKLNLNRNLIVSMSIITIYLSSNLIISNATTFRYLPKILSISPQTTKEAWVDVTINGKNFQDLPFVGKVTLAGEVQVENVHYWSNEKIIFRTNPATTKTGDICVETLSKGTSNCLPFEYNFNQKK